MVTTHQVRCQMAEEGFLKNLHGFKTINYSGNSGKKLTYQNPSVIFHNLSRPWLYLHSLCHTKKHGSDRILCNEQAGLLLVLFLFLWFKANICPNPRKQTCCRHMLITIQEFQLKTFSIILDTWIWTNTFSPVSSTFL